MSGWLIALAVSVAYLMQKKQTLDHKIDTAQKQFNSAACPAEPGPTSEQIRNVQRTVPASDRYVDMNIQDLSAKDVQYLQEQESVAAQKVIAYEQGPAPIEGVYLHYDNRGV